MVNKHEKPEFLLIRQNEANAKFYAASTQGNYQMGNNQHNYDQMVYDPSSSSGCSNASHATTYDDDNTQLW